MRSPRLSPLRISLALTCCAVMFLFALNFGAFSVLLPYLGASFGLGAAAEGRLFPANFVGFVAGVLFCGYLSDRLGRKLALLLGIACYACGLAQFGLAHTFVTLMIASALIGGGSGAMETTASALASDLFPHRRAFILNAIQIAFGAGAMVGPTLAHRLLSIGMSWQTLYLQFAAFTGSIFLLLVLQPVPHDRANREPILLDDLKAVFRQPAFLWICLAQALYVGAETGFFSWMPTYFRQSLPGGAAWEGLVVTIFWIAMTVGRTAVGGLVGRIPLLRFLFCLAAGSIFSSAAALIWTRPLPVLCFVALTGLGFSGIFGLIMAEAGERYPRFAGAVFGCVVASGGLGGALIPWLIPALADTRIGWRGAFALIPLLSASIAAISVALGKAGCREKSRV